MPSRKIFVAGLLLIILALALLWYLQPLASETSLTILYTADLHGHLEQNQAGGIARQAYLIKKIREENVRKGIYTLTLFAGDFMQGTLMSTFFKGEAEVRSLNLCGYNAATPGEHEFDYGLNNLSRLSKLAKFPLVNANVYLNNAPLFKTHLILEAGKIKIAILGLLTASPLTGRTSMASLKVRSPLAVASELVPQLRRDGQLVIALAHLNPAEERELAKIKGIDIILGGHLHQEMAKPEILGKTVIAHAGEKGKFLGRLELKIKGGKIISLTGGLIPVTHDLPEDPETRETVRGFRTLLNAARPIGEAAVNLIGEEKKASRRETNLGNLIANIMRQWAGAELAFLPGSTLQGNLPKGKITLENVVKIIPYREELIFLTLSGKEIERLMEYSLSHRGGKEFLQVGGIKVASEGGKIRGIKISGRPLQPQRNYRAITVTSLTEVEYGYRLNPKDQLLTEHPLADLFITYVREKKKIKAQVEGRIKIK